MTAWVPLAFATSTSGVERDAAASGTSPAANALAERAKGRVENESDNSNACVLSSCGSGKLHAGGNATGNVSRRGHTQCQRPGGASQRKVDQSLHEKAAIDRSGK